MRVVIQLFLILTLSSLCQYAIAQDQVTEQMVHRFSLNGGATSAILRDGGQYRSFIELTDEQLEKVRLLKSEITEKENRIRGNESLEFKEKLDKLIALGKEQEERTLGILLPHQVKLHGSYGTYLVINQEGLANSLVYGSLAAALGLTPEEREKIREEAIKVNKEYQEIVSKAQKDGIKKLIAVFPKEKRSQIEKILEPIADSGGRVTPANPIFDFSRKPIVHQPTLDSLTPKDKKNLPPAGK